MILGYNTNGLAHHELLDAIDLLAAVGYRGVALTLDHNVANPYRHGYESQVDKLRHAAAQHGLTYVVETGARFLLNPREKHEPTLVSATQPQRDRRCEFLYRAIDTAVLLGAQTVSLWSGAVRDGAPDARAMERLVAGMRRVLGYAAPRGVTLAFEPEPGMLIDTLARYTELKSHLADCPDAATHLRLTIDVGHLHCQGETPIADHIRSWGGELANVHLEDMRAGVHEHLSFGDGEIDFPPVLDALARIGYTGVVGVELSRHSHDAARVAREAFGFLDPLISRLAVGDAEALNGIGERTPGGTQDV